MINQRHDDSHQDGISEEQRGGNADRHVVVAQEERERRQRHEDAQDDELRQRMTTDTECRRKIMTPPSVPDHQQAEQRDAESVAEQEHRVGIHPVGIQRLGEYGIGAVGRCRERCKDVSGIVFHLATGSQVTSMPSFLKMVRSTSLRSTVACTWQPRSKGSVSRARRQ